MFFKKSGCYYNFLIFLVSLRLNYLTVLNENSDIPDEINEEMVSKNVCIKPKLLEGYRVIPCRKIKDHKDKKSAVKREDICPYCGKKTRSMKSHILVHAGTL